MTDARDARHSERVAHAPHPPDTVVSRRQTTRVARERLTIFTNRRHSVRVAIEPPPPETFAKFWDGSAWTSGLMKVWNGSTWRNVVAVKVWDGAAWVDAL